MTHAHAIKQQIPQYKRRYAALLLIPSSCSGRTERSLCRRGPLCDSWTSHGDQLRSLFKQVNAIALKLLDSGHIIPQA